MFEVVRDEVRYDKILTKRFNYKRTKFFPILFSLNNELRQKEQHGKQSTYGLMQLFILLFFYAFFRNSMISLHIMLTDLSRPSTLALSYPVLSTCSYLPTPVHTQSPPLWPNCSDLFTALCTPFSCFSSQSYHSVLRSRDHFSLCRISQPR